MLMSRVQGKSDGGDPAGDSGVFSTPPRLFEAEPREGRRSAVGTYIASVGRMGQLVRLLSLALLVSVVNLLGAWLSRGAFTIFGGLCLASTGVTLAALAAARLGRSRAAVGLFTFSSLGLSVTMVGIGGGHPTQAALTVVPLVLTCGAFCSWRAATGLALAAATTLPLAAFAHLQLALPTIFQLSVAQGWLLALGCLVLTLEVLRVLSSKLSGLRAEGEATRAELASLSERTEHEREALFTKLRKQRRAIERQLALPQPQVPGPLSQDVAHNLNNQLTVVMNCSALLRRELRGDAQALSLLSELSRATDVAAALVRGQACLPARRSADQEASPRQLSPACPENSLPRDWDTPIMRTALVAHGSRPAAPLFIPPGHAATQDGPPGEGRCASRSTSTVGAPPAVLIVDDDHLVQRAISRTLERAGYPTLATDSIQGARDLAQRHAGSLLLVITDENLPNGTGMGLTQALKAYHPGLAVLLVSGAPEVAAAAPGDVGFLSKPFRTDALLGTVQGMIGPPKAESFRPRRPAPHKSRTLEKGATQSGEILRA